MNSKPIVKRIVEAAKIEKNDVILEVGPGKGILTEELLKHSQKVIAVEKDKRLFEFLAAKFRDRANLLLIQGDILKIYDGNWVRVASQRKALRRPSGHGSCQRQESEAEQRGGIATLGRLTPSFRATNPSPILQLPKNYKIVANIPYYITSRFLRNFLSAKNQPQKMVLMVQKEMAERICAIPPRMNLLAISVQVFGKPKILFKVPKNYFSPAPKVDSSVIAINDISRKFFSVKDEKINEKVFFNLVKTGFSHKRKLLIGNLSKIANKNDLKNTFKKCGISLKSRAENLSSRKWSCLFNNFCFKIK